MHMIRPNIQIGDAMEGDVKTVYPPLQWNDCTSTRKMITDTQVWLHNHYPEWKEAVLHLMHYYNGKHLFNSLIPMQRGVRR